MACLSSTWRSSYVPKGALRSAGTYLSPLHVILGERVPISELLQASSDADYFPEVSFVINGELDCIWPAVVNLVWGKRLLLSLLHREHFHAWILDQPRPPLHFFHLIEFWVINPFELRAFFILVTFSHLIVYLGLLSFYSTFHLYY